METLIKKTTLIRTPDSFIDCFDKWRNDEGKKNNTEISRSMGFKMMSEVLPFISLDVKTNRKKKEINLKLI